MKLLVGEITNSHGVKGEVTVFPFTDNPERFKSLDWVLVEKREEVFEKMDIEKVFFVRNLVVLKLSSLETANDALKFKGCKLYIPKDLAAVLPLDSHYIFDLIGLEAFDEDNNYLGKLKEVIENPANDLYLICNGERSFYVPAVKEFIKKVDLPQGKIIIKLIEGMIE